MFSLFRSRPTEQEMAFVIEKVEEANRASAEARRYEALYRDLRTRLEHLGVEPYKGLLAKHTSSMIACGYEVPVYWDGP